MKCLRLSYLSQNHTKMSVLELEIPEVISSAFLGDLAELLCPLADGRRTDAELPSDLGLREMAGAEHATGCEPSLLDLFGCEFGWSPHAYKRTAKACDC